MIIFSLVFGIFSQAETVLVTAFEPFGGSPQNGSEMAAQILKDSPTQKN